MKIFLLLILEFVRSFGGTILHIRSVIKFIDNILNLFNPMFFIPLFNIFIEGDGNFHFIFIISKNTYIDITKELLSEKRFHFDGIYGFYCIGDLISEIGEFCQAKINFKLCSIL